MSRGLSDRWWRLASSLCVVLLVAPPAPGPSAAGSTAGGSFSVLKVLLETPGVSGHETRVRETIRDLLPEWARRSCAVDPKGNLILSAGRGGRELLFVAHMDETGYEIGSIERDGTARARSRGGFFNTLYEGHAVRILTRKGERGGIVRPREGYLAWSEGDAGLRDEEVVLDFGTSSRRETEEAGVAPGDPVFVPKKFRRLAGRMGTGRAVDDRAGCTALVEAVRRIDPGTLRNRVTFAWVVEEEIGLRGAAALAERLHPEVVFAVDTFVSSDSPLENKGFALGILGRGPVVRAIDNSNLAPAPLLDRVRSVAASRRIPLQIGITRGGNDGSVFPPGGAADVPISWPTTYSHSPVEVIHEGDLDDLGRLVQALAEEW